MTRKYGGSGLGLTISLRLAQMMQRSLWVESEPRVGSSFFFMARFALTVVSSFPVPGEKITGAEHS